VILIDLLVLLAFVGLIAVIVKLGSGRDSRRELRSAARRASIATAALRRIANGAGSPALEASIALDEIDQTYEKEIA